jgi:hypothetical protein
MFFIVSQHAIYLYFIELFGLSIANLPSWLLTNFDNILEANEYPHNEVGLV